MTIVRARGCTLSLSMAVPYLYRWMGLVRLDVDDGRYFAGTGGLFEEGGAVVRNSQRVGGGLFREDRHALVLGDDFG